MTLQSRSTQSLRRAYLARAKCAAAARKTAFRRWKNCRQQVGTTPSRIRSNRPLSRALGKVGPYPPYVLALAPEVADGLSCVLNPPPSASLTRDESILLSMCRHPPRAPKDCVLCPQWSHLGGVRCQLRQAAARWIKVHSHAALVIWRETYNRSLKQRHPSAIWLLRQRQAVATWMHCVKRRRRLSTRDCTPTVRAGVMFDVRVVIGVVTVGVGVRIKV